MSNYMAIICFLLYSLYTSPPLEGLGEVGNYMFNRQLTVNGGIKQID